MDEFLNYLIANWEGLGSAAAAALVAAIAVLRLIPNEKSRKAIDILERITDKK